MDGLAALKDIHTPTNVAIWPLAWGWWVLAFTVLLVIGIGIVLYIRHRRFTLAKRQAIFLLQQLEVNNSLEFITKANSILKRFARHYFPFENTNKIYGDNWKQWLTKHVKSSHVRQKYDPLLSSFTDAQYKQNATIDASELKLALISLVKVQKISHKHLSRQEVNDV